MKVKDNQILKQLHSRKAKLEVDLIENQRQVDEALSRHGKTKSQLNTVRKEISALQEKEITVTEHAMLKYLERMYGVDLEDLKKIILTESLKNAIIAYGDGKYPIDLGKVVVVGNSIVTVINEG